MKKMYIKLIGIASTILFIIGSITPRAYATSRRG